jgi:hypothetical protein
MDFGTLPMVQSRRVVYPALETKRERTKRWSDAEDRKNRKDHPGETQQGRQAGRLVGGPHVLSPPDREITPATRPAKTYAQRERKGERAMKRREEKVKGKRIPRKVEKGWVDPMATPMEIA